MSDREALRARVEAVRSWYHAIDLPGGVCTPGPFHMASFVHHYRLPERMEGLRALDVGASNGFFSFEMERRGAEEVVALDLPSWGAHDWTPRYRRVHEGKGAQEREDIDRQVLREGFEVVREALGSRKVRKVERSIYEVGPEALGTFDVVLCASMLMHVRDPVLGLQRLRSVVREGGLLVLSTSTALVEGAEPVARFVGRWDACNWWQMSPACVREVLRCCDFVVEGEGEVFQLRDVEGRFVDPTFVVHARPRGEGAGEGG